MLKRIIALSLAFVMTFAMLPLSVFAAEAGQTDEGTSVPTSGFFRKLNEYTEETLLRDGDDYSEGMNIYLILNDTDFYIAEDSNVSYSGSAAEYFPPPTKVATEQTIETSSGTATRWEWRGWSSS